MKTLKIVFLWFCAVCMAVCLFLLFTDQPEELKTDMKPIISVLFLCYAGFSVFVLNHSKR